MQSRFVHGSFGVAPMRDLSFVPISTWDRDLVAAIRRHYTGSRGAPPGRKLAFEIWDGDRMRGYFGLGEPPYKLAARRRLGIADARPLPGTVCDFIFRLEAPGASRASSILRALRPIAAAEWMRRYNETVVHWETMVLPSAVCSPVAGACYRRAGYRTIGFTTGRSARRPSGATHGPRVWGDAPPKLVLYFGPLARVSVAAPQPASI